MPAYFRAGMCAILPWPGFLTDLWSRTLTKGFGSCQFQHQQKALVNGYIVYINNQKVRRLDSNISTVSVFSVFFLFLRILM